jgi:uncharacterized iron-regulated membrane protein
LGVRRLGAEAKAVARVSGTPGPGTRLVWYQVHKYLGLTALAFLMTAAITGVLLVYDKALDAALNPDLFTVAGHSPRMEPAALASRFESANPELRVIAVPAEVSPGGSILLTVAARNGAHALAAQPGYDQVFVKPTDGSILGTRRNGPGYGRRHWVQDIYTLHTTLFAGRWGGRLMGAIGLVWLVEAVVGLYLTLPRRGPFFAKWKSAWSISWRSQWPRLMLDLHRAPGLWAFIAMVALAYSSFGIGLYDEALQPLVSAVSPPRPSLFDTPPASPDWHSPTVGFARAITIATARARHDGLAWRPAVATYLPDRAMYGVMFTRSGRDEYSGLGPITYYLDDRTGASVLVDDVYADSTGAKVLRATYTIHSGQVGGNLTRWLVIALGILVVEMCVTGLLVWWRKRQRRRRAQVVEYVN